MDRRSRSISPRRNRNGRSRRSRSRSRGRSREQNYRRRSRSRSRSRERRRGNSNEKDLYRDIIHGDYKDDKGYNSRTRDGRSRDDERDRWNDRGRDKGRDYEREQRDRDYHERDRERNDRKDHRRGGNNRHYNSAEREGFSDESDEAYQNQFNNKNNKTPSNTIIVMGLQQHITEADIIGALIQVNKVAVSIRLIRKRNTGASRGFAFVEFNTVEEAMHWMELTQGVLVLQDGTRAQMQYSLIQRANLTDWFCGKCGVLNFKRRENCFKCNTSREKAGEGSDEVSNILTKKIMLRNLDALTNEESVLTVLQQLVPDLAKRISKILISRDLLTQTSRGVCYLNFETLVDSMSLHNALNELDPPLKIDNRDVIVTYCMDHENRQMVPKKTDTKSSSSMIGPLTATDMAAAGATSHYTMADVPRLAEYSASMYASTPTEKAHYLQYYTTYYMSEISKGHFGNLPTDSQIDETSANSAAAVALSAIQRKQKKMNNIETTATPAASAAAAAAAAVKAAIAAQPIVTPKGNDGKIYPTPDVTLYQYDETSGYYYDPTTGLYYDAHSQYYYNNETGAYLYWDQRKSTYVLATPANAAAAVQEAIKDTEAAKAASLAAAAANEDETKKEKKDGNKHDKVKVAKKIVKDMEKWAKQLNQKKDYTVVATPQPILNTKLDDMPLRAQTSTSLGLSSGYADLGFSILEKKERNKLSEYVPPTVPGSNKLLTAYGSDSDDEHAATTAANAAIPRAVNTQAEPSEKDYVDFQKLTCLLCKRAFQSLEILQKHLKMSNLHKENLQKFNLTCNLTETELPNSTQSYRDRAKERRLKYGESDPPPPNRSRERFENELKSLTSRQAPEAPIMPIGSNNVGNRLLQKMGWSEGQGLGRKNQGRTNIIEADARNSTAGLGTKSGMGPGDDYKTYIKKMMKSRYESV